MSSGSSSDHTTQQPPQQTQMRQIQRESSSSPPPPKPTAAAQLQTQPEQCMGAPHLELWGAVVQPGTDNLQPNADACCQSCRELEPTLDVASGAQCNTWVYNPSTRACWLKYQKPDELEGAVKRIKAIKSDSGGKTPWHSGVWLEKKACSDCVKPEGFVGCWTKDSCNTARKCGSIAIDGYSHVDPKCIKASPTALLYEKLRREGTTLVPFHELNADYDGLGVRWGIGHKKKDWQECEAACLAFDPARSGGAPFGGLPCNVWTWCSQPVCFEPDAHSHSFGDCWLKFSEMPEAPEVNQRTPNMRAAFMRRHRKQMVNGTTWHSGALLAPGVTFTNGTWGPRAYW